ncbi:MAG TPA: UDP-N-acetylmuramate--L-alanine ligase [Acidimicrobiales bacterium]|nr:UDP-N-acetylmuramate--L-alanine ligase [Acidimicrobiales bacterium]
MAALDLSQPQRVHVVAIGGAAMNAMALILQAMGHRVTGSDIADSPVVERLRASGIVVAIGHDGAHVGDADVVAISTAVRDDNPEVVAARAAGIPVVTRPELQGAICALRKPVAVAGTHGKTTTTAMLALALRAAGLDPSFIVGGVVTGLGSGTSWTDADLLVVEADESDGTFLTLGANAVIVTNVEPDHLDHWGSFDALRDGFARFVAAAPGPKVVCADDAGSAAIAATVAGCTTYGTSDGADYRWRDGIVTCPDGAQIPLASPVPGLHNARNATAAFAMADLLGADRTAVAAALASFAGVARRWEPRGTAAGVAFVDSYDHLPSEVKAVLSAAREGVWKRIVCVFEPHRATRTRDLHRQFADAFDDADVLAVTDIYLPAGQQPIPGVTGKLVVDAVLEARPWKRVAWLPRRSDVRSWLLAELRPGDLCLTLGAGDLTTLPDEIIPALQARGA